MPEFVVSILKSMGAAGAAISILLTAISILGTVITILFKQNNAHNKARLAEREVLIKLVESSNSAFNKNSEATEERNKVTQELADAIAKQAQAFELVNQRVGFYHEANTEKLKDMREVVASGADAMRVNTGMLTEVRNGNLLMQATINEMKTSLARRSR